MRVGYAHTNHHHSSQTSLDLLIEIVLRIVQQKAINLWSF